MDMTGERRIPAPREVVWDALNNPEVLKASIPGCESLEKLSDTQMKATAAVKLGPISARFTGNVLLSEIDPPNSYRISGEGQGGVAGFAKGGASVKLTDDAADTLLSYQVNAQVGGKLAQLGARLIDASAKQMADAFFDRFSKQVQAMSPVQAPLVEEASATAPVGAVDPAPAAGITYVAPAGAMAQPGSTQPAPAQPAPIRQPAPMTPLHMPKSPPSAIPLSALIPAEPFGLPIAAWIGGAVFLVMVLLMLGSMI